MHPFVTTLKVSVMEVAM